MTNDEGDQGAVNALVPKLCLGMPMSRQLCCPSNETEFRKPSAFPNRVWERGDSKNERRFPNRRINGGGVGKRAFRPAKNQSSNPPPGERSSGPNIPPENGGRPAREPPSFLL